jgi:hypothetical protein
MKPILANPVEMIAQGAPRVIHSDRELAAYTEALVQLTALENPSVLKRKPSNSSPSSSINMSRHITPFLLQMRFQWCGSLLSGRALHNVI